MRCSGALRVRPNPGRHMETVSKFEIPPYLLIGVGTAGCPVLPPPNRTCGSPAYGSPVSGSPPSGLADQVMSRGKEEQPLLGKEGIGPFEMIEPVAATEASGALAKDTA